MTFQEVLSEAPNNFVIQNALERCFDITKEHRKILCSCSGGSDSDVMLDMLIRCGVAEKTDFVFFDTGIEYAATMEHLDFLEGKYGIRILRERAIHPVPIAVRDYGQPFWGKFVSEMIYRLQKHGFTWEDRPFEELIVQYPNCKTALEWWCNVTQGKSDQYAIKRAPYLKEFMIENPPWFLISDKCCTYAKKKVAEKFTMGGGYDLSCIGIRQSEGGIRAASHKTCFSKDKGIDHFYPVFYLRDADKEEYCTWYGVTHSRCYTEYGLERTGCFGCPFGKRFEEELRIIEDFEPKLLRAAHHIFRDSYEYTRQYLKFREEKKNAKKSEEKGSDQK